jgi:hyperosmotically inducible periplasmic protein
MGLLALGAGLGALLAYFFDRENGKRRRQQAIDRTAAVARKRAARAGRGVASEAYGVAKKVQRLREEPKEFDDATLADKVRSEALRGEEVPAGEINVNVQDGVVQLRGEVEGPELINELVDRVRKVQGVRDVENLLHLPGTEAPMHE